MMQLVACIVQLVSLHFLSKLQLRLMSSFFAAVSC